MRCNPLMRASLQRGGLRLTFINYNVKLFIEQEDMMIILRLPYEGDNPKIKQLIESVDDFVLGVERLHWAAVPEQQISVTPENVSQCYNSIKYGICTCEGFCP
eukprot:sb/3478219/